MTLIEKVIFSLSEVNSMLFLIFIELNVRMLRVYLYGARLTKERILKLLYSFGKLESIIIDL